MAHLLDALDADWRRYRGSVDGARALAAWATDDPRYRRFKNLDELRLAFEARCGLDERDDLLADLVQRCPDDDAARRVVLAALRPGLVHLARRAGAFWDPDDAESAVVTATLERLARRSGAPPARVAGGLLAFIWRTVWMRRQRERSQEVGWGRRETDEALELVPSSGQDEATSQFLVLVGEAVRSGRVTSASAHLIVLHRLLGYSNIEIARMYGYKPCTIRKRRREAELRLAELAVA